jgi:sulfur-carrier protein
MPGARAPAPHPPSCIFRPSCGIIMAMPKIHIPTPLRQYAGKQAAVEVKAGTIADSLNDLVAQHPDLRRHLYTDEGKLRAFVNVYLNDEDVRYLQKEATSVNDSDTISIVPSIAGGSHCRMQISECRMKNAGKSRPERCCRPSRQ